MTIRFTAAYVQRVRTYSFSVALLAVIAALVGRTAGVRRDNASVDPDGRLSEQ